MSTEAKILHVFNFEEKFSAPFFDFLLNNGFNLSTHQLFHYGKHNEAFKKYKMPFIFARYHSVLKHLKLLRNMFKSRKIIIHSLASPWLLLFLFCFPKLNKKVYWVIWGKDLYFFKLLPKKQIHHHVYEFFRVRVFKRITHVVTCVPGDAALAKKWYGVNATRHDCIMYPSNLYKQIDCPIEHHEGCVFLLGNSADPSNNHIELLDKIKPLKDSNIQIYAPLSYGCQHHRNEVIHHGHAMFGNQFKPLTSFLAYEDYLALLAKVDVAVFGHKRQQAMGNTISLLGLGKKVYMDTASTAWSLFQNLGIKVFDNSHITTKSMSKDDMLLNKEKIKNHFSVSHYKSQLQELFS